MSTAGMLIHICVSTVTFFLLFLQSSTLTWLNAAFWVWISGTIRAFPTFNAGKNVQGKEGYRNSCQEGILPLWLYCKILYS
jgi:hypothetical protein